MARHVPARELHLGRDGGGGGGGGGRDLLDATSAVKDGLNALPGFKTSAAFFTFLRANLVLPPTSTTHSAMSSNTSTPLLTPSTSQILPPPSPSHLSPTSSPSLPTTSTQSSPPDLSTIPPLTTYALTSPDERLAGLKLIADSVAQDRQTASRALIFHPLTAAIWVLLLALIYQYFYHVPGDIGIVVTTSGGMTMAVLVAVRMITGPYLSFAEEITWEFLTNPDTGDEDMLIGSKFGDEVIAALVLRLEGGTATAGSGKKKNKTGKTGKSGMGVIRAWTTRLRYRRKGVGTGLLEEAVRITRDRFGRDAEVGFAAEHANAKRVLPEMFNGGFRRREQLAIRQLEAVVVDDGVKRKK